MKEIGIVVCNYNKAEMVVECVQCLLENRYKDYDIYVVDNASTDQSVPMLKERYGDQITLLVNKENLGGSGGFNTGLRVVYEKGYKYLMCIDNDALLDENAIGNLHAFLEEHQEVGMAASKIYHMNAPGLIQQFGQKIDFDYFCTEVPHLNMIEDESMPPYLYVDAVGACSLMIRRTTVDQIGLLPEDYFLYWDDTEWCYKCNLAGMKVASVGTSKALHDMGAKKEVINTFPTYYAWRNWISFFIKYTPPEKWERMAETFLSSIFDEIFSDMHKGVKNRATTIMLAYDDALHGITGKAGENRIFDLDVNNLAYHTLFMSSDQFYIDKGDFPTLAQRIRNKAEELGYKIEWQDRPSKHYPTIRLCESIFHEGDTSLAEICIDIDECILQNEADALNVINYAYSKRAFIFSQLPLFLQRIRELKA